MKRRGTGPRRARSGRGQRPGKASSRADLLRKVRRPERAVGGDACARDPAQEMQIYQEEFQAQRTELLGWQRALEVSRDRYADLFDYAPMGYVGLDRNGLVDQMNRAAGVLFGVDRNRAVGFPFLLYVSGRGRRLFLQHMHRCRHERWPVETALELQAKAGRSFPAQLVSRRMPDAEGHVSFLTAVLDLSERERAECAEEERQRLLRDEAVARAEMDAKDRFLATLSHELRTPLTPILFALATIEASPDVPAALRTTFAMIRRNVQHEARLIDDLLDLTRIGRDKLHLRLEHVDLHALLQEVAVMFQAELREARLEVRLELDARRHRLDADPVRLRQVFANLLKNAIRYTPAAGHVIVRSESERGTLRVTVQDTGAGIAPEMLARIFSPFEQADEYGRGRGGLGLGLAICKGLLEAHGGRITVASPGLGRGSTFTVELEISRADAAPAHAVDGQGRATQPSKWAILLVEDDQDSAAAIRESLRMHGYEVRVAHTVRDALREGPDDIDVLISDIGLPDGSGLEVMREFRARRPVHGIALSGYGGAHHVTESGAAGFERHLVKPITAEVLLRELETLARDVLA